ncbi:MAG TPA: OsmC family protein [Ornithinimicrobium sp.]|uniref:OsmC family protein n=1 Tax=Ornithinimicrobium sp. TaxID=1977084 RepID=UPI002B49EF6B|nr:OsmC family protein [Ornithinimicrobium sp.]HKJ12201.1 OsmC family protein [Ornithinimicrobium sp.]
MATHTYATRLRWTGSTGLGYAAYERGHHLTVAGAPGVSLTADPAFGGDPSHLNPELLVLAAASSCQLLSFLAVAARARVDVVGYTDEAVAEMPEDVHPVRITHITLRPHITIRGSGGAKVERLVEVAHRECFVAHTLSCDMSIDPTVSTTD